LNRRPEERVPLRMDVVHRISRVDNHSTKNGHKDQNGDVVSLSGADLSITHPLEHEWTFWYDKRWVRGGEVSYENNLKKIGTFGTVEDFWRHYNHMAKPAQLEWDSNYYLFKKGIKPMWEDEENHNGGSWLIVIRRDVEKCNTYWEKLLLGMIGETLEEDDEICGAVLARRKAMDKISLWNRNLNPDAIMRIGRRVKSLLNITEDKITYQSHGEQITKINSVLGMNNQTSELASQSFEPLSFVM